jgi:hypothetical protein
MSPSDDDEVPAETPATTATTGPLSRRLGSPPATDHPNYHAIILQANGEGGVKSVGGGGQRGHSIVDHGCTLFE